MQHTLMHLLTGMPTTAWFFDQNNGIICPRNGAGILKTTDGGETFDTLRIFQPVTPYGKEQ